MVMKMEFQIDSDYCAHLRWNAEHPLVAVLSAKGFDIRSTRTGWKHCTFEANYWQMLWLSNKCKPSNVIAARMLTVERLERMRTGMYGLAVSAKLETHGCEDYTFRHFSEPEDDEYQEFSARAAAVDEVEPAYGLAVSAKLETHGCEDYTFKFFNEPEDDEYQEFSARAAVDEVKPAEVKPAEVKGRGKGRSKVEVAA